MTSQTSQGQTSEPVDGRSCLAIEDCGSSLVIHQDTSERYSAVRVLRGDVAALWQALAGHEPSVIPAVRDRAAALLVSSPDDLPEGWGFEAAQDIDEATALDVAQQLVEGVVRCYLEALDG